MECIKDIQKYKDKEIKLSGWVYNYRSSGKIAFLQLRDGTGFIQCVAIKNNLSEEEWQKVEKITQETSVEIEGLVKEDSRSDIGFEIEITKINILQIPEEEYPIGNKEHGADFLLNNRHLWLRSRRQWAIQKIRNTIINATYKYFEENNFTKIDSPILTPSSCEDTTELFEVDYFDRKAYLSQSGQLYLEAAIFSLGKVFDFGPVFRAEKSKTRRHLTEFWMMDAEMAFHDYKDNMKVQEELICYILEQVLKENKNELLILERNIETLEKIKAPFIYKTHKEVVEELQEMGSDIKQGEDLGADDETILTKKYDNPIFVSKYPKNVKAFYMKEDPEDKDVVLCSDLLAPEGYGEIIGGSERETDYNILMQKIKEKNLDPKVFSWYLDLRKYGSVKHSGFGYGLERIVAWICGLKHVRETIPFPRTIHRLDP
ncbi:asparagine--tRNA ligase [Patescibacteria group bacterium]|nr:asparagine--tRNA ligase [Patescibacteria group bacterium]